MAWLAGIDWAQTAKDVAPYLGIAVTFGFSWDTRRRWKLDVMQRDAGLLTLTPEADARSPDSLVVHIRLHPPAPSTAYAVDIIGLNGARASVGRHSSELGIEAYPGWIVRDPGGEFRVWKLRVALDGGSELREGQFILEGPRGRVRAIVVDLVTGKAVFRKTYPLAAQ